MGINSVPHDWPRSGNHTATQLREGLPEGLHPTTVETLVRATARTRHLGRTRATVYAALAEVFGVEAEEVVDYARSATTGRFLGAHPRFWRAGDNNSAVSITREAARRASTLLHLDIRGAHKVPRIEERGKDAAHLPAQTIRLSCFSKLGTGRRYSPSGAAWMAAARSAWRAFGLVENSDTLPLDVLADIYVEVEDEPMPTSFADVAQPPSASWNPDPASPEAVLDVVEHVLPICDLPFATSWAMDALAEQAWRHVVATREGGASGELLEQTVAIDRVLKAINARYDIEDRRLHVRNEHAKILLRGAESDRKRAAAQELVAKTDAALTALHGGPSCTKFRMTTCLLGGGTISEEETRAIVRGLEAELSDVLAEFRT